MMYSMKGKALGIASVCLRTQLYHKQVAVMASHL